MAKLNVNGKLLDYQAEAETPLLWVIREQLGLTGTKYGCALRSVGLARFTLMARRCVRVQCQPQPSSHRKKLPRSKGSPKTARTRFKKRGSLSTYRSVVFASPE